MIQTATETKMRDRNRPKAWRNKLFANKKNCSDSNLQADDTDSATMDCTPHVSEESNLDSVPSSESSERADSNCDAFKPILPNRTISLPCARSESDDHDPLPLLHSISWSYQLVPDPDDHSALISSTSSSTEKSKKKKKKKSIKARFNDPSTWLKAMNKASEKEKITMFGLGVAVAGTVVIHPLFFLGGVVWAVGVLSTDSSYSFFSNPSFSNLFWTEPDDNDKKESPEVLLRRVAEPSYIEQIEIVRHRTEDDVQVTLQTTDVDKKGPTTHQDMILPTPSLSAPEKEQQTHERYIISEEHFPKLDHHIISDRVFDGLKATECFELFFDDEAPFSFSQFQETMGDVNISYEKWIENDMPQQSFHPNSSLPCEHITKQLSRVTTFRTLTKSYFGPAYAEAKKVQIASFFSEDMLVMENKTILSGIPFGDKFFVLERWVLETKDDKNSMLNASVQVCMLTSSCPFEGQIRKKSLQGCTDMFTLWTRSATEALELTKQEKQKAIENIDSTSEDNMCEEDILPNESNDQYPEPCTNSLVHKHLTNFKELEKMIDFARQNGNLEYIEVFGDNKYMSNNVINTAEGIEVLQLIASIDETEENENKKDAHSIEPIEEDMNHSVPKVSGKQKMKIMIQKRTKKFMRLKPKSGYVN